MAVLLQADIYEQILIKLDVQDLIKYKGVCKSWYSLISDARFTKNHLNHSYNNYHHHRNNNNKIQILHRRVVMSDLPISQFQFGFGTWFFMENDCCHLLGSSNGLICVAISNTHLLLANPLTREVKKLGNCPQCPNRATNLYCYAENSLCWGFGYNSVMDDYKVIVGFMKSEYVTCFHVLSLKSSVWEHVGQVKYSHLSSIGVLCNEALHWLMMGRNKNKVILSFNLSVNKFKEIPQPDNDVTYQSFVDLSDSPMLGTIEECLCIFDQEWLPKNVWKMNDYNVKRSWEMVGHDDWEIKNDVVHWLQGLKQGIPYDKSLCHDIHLCRTIAIIGAPIFVQSLVSPHVHDHGKHKRKMQSKNSERRAKFIKRGSSVPGLNDRV